ncbi:MAG: sugar phosphate isomerase/epimerase family protein [Opitutales bacterium]
MKFIASTAFTKTDHAAALDTLAGLGFREIDLLSINDWGLVSPALLVADFDAAVDRVRSVLEPRGLKAVSLNTAFTPQLFEREDEAENERRREQVRAVCRFMVEMGIKIGAHYPGYIADWKNDPEGVFASTVETLREVQAIAREHGVTLAPEIHAKTPFEAPDNARRLINTEIPGIPYTYEPSHFIISGLDGKATDDLLDGATHCHFRTCAEGQIQAAPPDGFDALDWMMDRLRARNYDGYISIEYLPGAEFSVENAIRTLLERYG